MKKTIALIFTGALFLPACNQIEEQPKTPIFEGTKEISLTLPLNNGTIGTAMTYSVPSEVKFVVFGLFNAQITTSGKTITNPGAFVAGSRDGLSDFVRGSQTRASLHSYNQTTKDFNAAASDPGNNNYYWAVWGYDQYGNLTHSSAQRQVTF
ncbi:hypothetical protein [Turneriella parva]|uniref:Uncharacterized protein n=1 Tax=Turneriella parva (strain ATCC BAA-1111 / DSM 21527 / NCTC 11395 / H) TaxID=869212 RepID=I4B8W7_TURPD|nr:hypothetical protein [Turneriella parva]AFM13724.1 hypothetical protein Turpa_3085 [Turneriella parva DSM 21527]